MIDRTLAQHAGTAPDLVGEDLRARSRRAAAAASRTRASDRRSRPPACPPRPPRASRRSRSRRTRGQREHARQRRQRRRAGQVDDARARRLRRPAPRIHVVVSRVAGAADQHAGARRCSTSFVTRRREVRGQPPLRRAVRRTGRQRPRAAARRPILVDVSSVRAAAMASSGTRQRRLERPALDAERTNQMLVVLALMDAPVRPGDRRASAVGAAQVGGVSPSLSECPARLTSHADCERVRQQDRDVGLLRSQRSTSCSGARARPCHSATIGRQPEHDRRRDRPPTARGDDQPRGREPAPDVGDRRQRHHGVAQPVGRQHEHAADLRGIATIAQSAAVTASSRLAASSARPGSRSRQRRCIHSQSSGSRRTYISSTSVQRCVNSRTASGESSRGGGDRLLVHEPVAAARQRQREHRNHRRAGAQRERRQRRRRRRRPSKKST